VSKKLHALDQSLNDLQKKLDSEDRHVARLGKDTSKSLAAQAAAYRKDITTIARRVDDISKTVVGLRKELRDNNAKLIEAVKKTLPKVKEAAVADLNQRLVPLEKGVSELRGVVERQRKTAAPAKQNFPAQPSKDVLVLTKRIHDLEEIVSAQKGFLLEVGSKVHDLEARLARAVSAAQSGYPPASR
jgi:chromosome segregation ATPase